MKRVQRGFLSLVLLTLVAANLPTRAEAAVTFCNSSTNELWLRVVIEDPNLRLFSKYPWSSIGWIVIAPQECEEVSGARSDGLSVYFDTMYKIDGTFVPTMFGTDDDVTAADKSFCVHPTGGWKLMGETAVICSPGYEKALFQRKLSVSRTTGNYTLRLGGP